MVLNDLDSIDCLVLLGLYALYFIRFIFVRNDECAPARNQIEL